MKFLLSTNVISDSVKTSPNKAALELIKRHQLDIVTAAPVWHELNCGCLRLSAARKRDINAAFLKDQIKRLRYESAMTCFDAYFCMPGKGALNSWFWTRPGL